MPNHPCLDERSGLQLRVPRVTYGDVADLAPSPRMDEQTRVWQRVDPRWRFSDGAFALTIGTRPLPHPGDAALGGVVTINGTALRPLRIRRCVVNMAVDCPDAPLFLDRYLQWRPLRGAELLNDYSPLVLRWTRADRVSELRSHRGFVAAELRWHRGTLEVGIVLDAAALHPRWMFKTVHSSEAAPQWSPGRSAAIELVLTAAPAQGATPPAVLGRFPRGAEAAFALTDHCDFDREDRLRAFMYGNGGRGGWVGRGLRLTKSVFTVKADGVPGEPAPTIDNPGYRELIQRLADDGSEIVPHSLSEWGGLDPAAFAAALARIANQWHGRTWIDHGYVPYNYTMGGGDDPAILLLAALRRHGFVALAAGHDIPSDPSASLNMLAPPLHDLGAVATAAWRHIRSGRRGVALRYLRASMHRRLSGGFGYLLDGVFVSLSGILKIVATSHRISREQWSETWGIAQRRFQTYKQNGASAFRANHTRRDLLDIGAVVYPERAVPLNQVRDDDLLLFTTHESVHTEDIYTPDSLTALVEERGLHIGHTYLLNRLPYVAGIFDRAVDMPAITPAWATFVETLAEFSERGLVWNPCVSDLVAYMRDVQQVAMVPNEHDSTLSLTNHGAITVRDVCVLLPPTVPPEGVRWGATGPNGTRRWREWLAVWGDLGPHATITVQWSPTAERTAGPAAARRDLIGVAAGRG